MNKEDLALNNLKWLICHKTRLNQIVFIQCIYENGSDIKLPTIVNMP